MCFLCGRHPPYTDLGVIPGSGGQVLWTAGEYDQAPGVVRPWLSSQERLHFSLLQGINDSVLKLSVLQTLLLMAYSAVIAVVWLPPSSAMRWRFCSKLVWPNVWEMFKTYNFNVNVTQSFLYWVLKLRLVIFSYLAQHCSIISSLAVDFCLTGLIFGLSVSGGVPVLQHAGSYCRRCCVESH
jgi:hypothetical protein